VLPSEAFGVQYIHSIRSPLHEDSKTTALDTSTISKKAERWLSIQHHPTAQDCVADLRRFGYSIWVADLQNGTPLDSIRIENSLKKKSENPLQGIAVVFGNELNGITDEMLRNADEKFVLPMNGFIQSFNISVSVGVCLESLRNLNFLEPNLSMEEQEKLKLHWLMQDLPKAQLLLKQKNIAL